MHKAHLSFKSPITTTAIKDFLDSMVVVRVDCGSIGGGAYSHVSFEFNCVAVIYNFPNEKRKEKKSEKHKSFKEEKKTGKFSSLNASNLQMLMNINFPC